MVTPAAPGLAAMGDNSKRELEDAAAGAAEQAAKRLRVSEEERHS